MSDLLIRGMEMPKNLGVSVTIYPDGRVIRYLGYGAKEQLGTAVPVPTHGRLIEAEPIMKFIADGLNSGEYGYDQIKVLTEIQYAPTIIPAEEDE